MSFETSDVTSSSNRWECTVELRDGGVLSAMLSISFHKNERTESDCCLTAIIRP
jgi:hypothetical protein